MNLLIIGGLFAVAILAVVGIVFLSLSERNAEAVRKANTQPATPPIARSARPTVPLTATEDREPAPHTAAKEPVIQRQRFSRKSETNSADREENQLLPMLNGQFHEFVDELRDLHQQAWELEQRLSVLTQMVDHIERTQANRISIEEEETIHIADTGD